MVQYLISQDVKLIIYGCNTATANALQTMRQEFTVPMIGVIRPGSQEASEVTKTDHVGIIATESTINSMSYNKTIREIDAKIKVLGVPAQKFVALVEGDKVDTKEAKDEIETTLRPFKDNEYDTLILGCTHFPMLKKQINNYLPKTKLVDPAVSTVVVAKNYLTRSDLLTDSKNRTIRLHATSGIDNFSRLAKRWLDTDIKEISLVNIGGNDERNNNSH